jgi:nucleoside-diphosphate-sugar epimerase
MAASCETIWRTLRLKGSPPVTRIAVWLSALDTTIDISHARTELGYEPVRTIGDGMAELRELARREPVHAQPSASRNP